MGLGQAVLTDHMALGAINQMKAWQGLQTDRVCKPGASSVTLMTKERCWRDRHTPTPPQDLISSVENKGWMGFHFSLWLEQTCVSVSFGEI